MTHFFVSSSLTYSVDWPVRRWFDHVFCRSFVWRGVGEVDRRCDDENRGQHAEWCDGPAGAVGGSGAEWSQHRRQSDAVSAAKSPENARERILATPGIFLARCEISDCFGKRLFCSNFLNLTAFFRKRIWVLRSSFDIQFQIKLLYFFTFLEFILLFWYFSRFGIFIKKNFHQKIIFFF